MKSRLYTSLRSLTIVLLLVTCIVPASAGSRGISGGIPTDDSQKLMLPLILADYPLSVTVPFDRYPDGTPITSDTILNGDEFLSAGIRPAGAPEGSYCQSGTAAAILVPPHHIDLEFTFLTSSEPDRLACHAVPVAITFVQDVRHVTLEFAGSTAVHTMKVYDSAGGLLGTADQAAVWGGGTFEVSYTSANANIARVTFGRELSTTAVKELRYSR